MRPTRPVAAGLAAALAVSILTVAPSANADTSPATTTAPAGTFSDASRDVDRLLEGRIAAAATDDAAAIPQELTSLAGTEATPTVSVCPAGAATCIRRAPDDTSGGASVAAAGWPKVCSANQYDTTPKWLGITRRAACFHDKANFTIYKVGSGEVTGTFTAHMGLTAEAVAGGAGWNTTGYLALWRFTGNGKVTWTTASILALPSGKAKGGITSWGASGGFVWKGSGWVSAPTMASKAVVNGVGGAWEVTMGNPEWDNVAIWPLDRFKGRCDRYYSTPGCVFPTVPGVATFSKATAPQYAKHVSGAIKSGLPGKFGSSSYISRITSKPSTAKNRAKACPSSLKRPSGYSCDEYPFASTRQGAYTSGATRARSQPWCRMKDPARTGSKGWSRCFITKTQNSIGGGYLSGFYRYERMLTGDKFQVGFIA